jgi:RNA polymerase sigma factor (sigma-70 family)
VKKKILLNDEQKTLLEKHYRLLFFYIKNNVKNDKLKADMEEIIDELNMRFCIAASHYDQSRGYKFSTFSYKCFEHGVQQLHRKKFKEKKRDFKVVRISEREYKEFEDDKITMDFNFLIAVINSVKTVSEKSKKILFSYFLENKTLEQTGVIFNLSRERIRQIISDSLCKIKKYIKNNDIKEIDFFVRGINIFKI